MPEIDKVIGQKKVEQALLNYKPKEQSGVWLHYASKRYSLGMKELEDLAGFIVERINADFILIMNEIIQVLVRSKI